MTKDLPILQEDQTAKWERLKSAIESRVITEEFARQQMGWPASAAPPIAVELPARAQELRAYRRKALNAHRRGESADVEFVPDLLDEPQMAAIRSRLKEARTEAEIVSAFDG
jgi:hypothetical protein